MGGGFPTPILAVTAVPGTIQTCSLPPWVGHAVVLLVTSLEVSALWPTSMGFLCPQQLGQQLTSIE